MDDFVAAQRDYQETRVLRSDTVTQKNVLLKTQTSSRGTKTPTHLNENPTANEEKDKNKLLKTALNKATTSNAAKQQGLQRTQLQNRKNEFMERNKLVSPKISSRKSQQLKPAGALRAKPSLPSNVAPTQQKLFTTTGKTKNKAELDKNVMAKKPNTILDTQQNVTVCSPPPKKKNVNGNQDHKIEKPKLIRKESHTLAPDEIIVLKRESAKKRSEENIKKEILAAEPKATSTEPTTTSSALKEPIAFEIKFDEKAAKEKSKPLDDARTKTEDDNNYSDDFESYESDFETGSSIQSSSSSTETTSELSSLSSGSEGKAHQSRKRDQHQHDLTSEESEQEPEHQEFKQTPRDKERKFDSGHYDLNTTQISNKVRSEDPATLQFMQSKRDLDLEPSSLGASERLDSGISTCTTLIPDSDNKNIKEISYGGYSEFFNKPLNKQRGSELLKKIQFDVLSFSLLDLKPISYDLFMQTFGKLNTAQNFTQTHDNQMDMEQQTDIKETRSVWTQHPAHFDLEIMKYLNLKNGLHNLYCCGEITTECPQGQTPPNRLDCKLEQTLELLKQNNKQKLERTYEKRSRGQSKPLNYEHLNSFLLRSSLLMDQILGPTNTPAHSKTLTTPRAPSLAFNENKRSTFKQVFEKSFYIATNILNTLKVLKVYSNNKHNLLITVHESLPETNVYSSDFTNLLMVWCTQSCAKPLRLLTAWSQVSKVEISNDSVDIIVAALRDGSIALWDLKETHSFCSKLDGYLTHFPATQSIIPTWSFDNTNNSKLIMDLGACLDVKSFKSQYTNILAQTTFPRTQFVSLYDSGIVTVWTLVETSEAFLDVPPPEKYDKYSSKHSSKCTNNFEYTSPWARVKLMQSAVVNIKEHFEAKALHSQTRFEKTKTLFQKNIYSDEALRELNECLPEKQQQGLRFTSLECGTENIFICTNRNYILMCSKSLKMKKLKRIMIDESQFLFPTVLKVLSNEYFLAVGLSNGVVIILNCQSVYKRQMLTRESAAVNDKDDDTTISSDQSSFTGKSCAIQNILLNVEKSCENLAFETDYRPTTAACITLIDSKKKPFELRIFDQQVIISGSALRKNLIQSLQLSSDGWYLFALANGQLRVYDFYLDQEILCNDETETIIDIATAKCGYRENSLIILKPNTEVEVHILNK